MKNKPLKIELTNLDNTTKNTLHYFIKSNLCKNAVLAEDNTFDLSILDLDIKYDNQVLENLKGSKNYIIALYISECNIKTNDNIFTLKKPINVSDLVTLINKVHDSKYNTVTKAIQSHSNEKTVLKTKIDSSHSHLYNAVAPKKIKKNNEIHLRYKAQKFVGSNKDINKDDIDISKIYLTDKKYLYYYLEKMRSLAQANKSHTILKTSSKSIFYNFRKKIFLYKLEKNQLKYLQSSILVDNPNISTIDDIFDSDNMVPINENEFIWQTSIQASKGRIPINTDIHKTVKMTNWPNFTKLQVFRYNIQICALWSQYKISLYDTAKQLNIPQRYVFTLYSAMNALGYLKIEKTDSITQIIETKSNNSSLFSRIIAHVFG